MNKNPLISVLILNYNGADLLEECILSVIQTRYMPIEIIVIDNNSTDNSLEIIEKFKKVKIIRNYENYGYAEGNNIGISKCSGKYVVTLNNDMTVDPDWLKLPVQVLESNQDIGIVSCRQMAYYHHEKIDTLFHILRPDLTFYPFGQQQRIDKDPRFLQSGYVLSANGGSAIIRKEMFLALKGFDSRFFAYLDEADLCMKAFLHGWSCFYVPSAVVYHKGSVSFKKTGSMQYYYRERNRIWFLYKYFPVLILLKHLPFLLMMELRVLRVMCFKLKKPDLYFKARIEGFRYLHCYKNIRKYNLRLFSRKRKKFNALVRKYILPFFPEV